MKIIILIVCFVGLLFKVEAQHPVGDKLEQLYSQGYYSLVFRKAGKFLLKNDTKHLIAPKYYRALAGLQKASNYFWLKRNSEIPFSAFNELDKLKKDEKGKLFLEAHVYELYELKNDLSNWLTDLKQTKLKDSISSFSKRITQFYSGIDLKSFEIIPEEQEVDSDYSGISKIRTDLIQTAKSHLGVPYVWGGESPEGFDCSGFTQYVLKSKGYVLPRTAGDQYQKAIKIEAAQVQAGDLVFFKNDKHVSHVGMIISKKGDPVKMIHASSSLGISIIEIQKSEYWNKRFFAYGTFLN